MGTLQDAQEIMVDLKGASRPSRFDFHFPPLERRQPVKV